jgi:protein required for attachment to host cells
MDIDNGTVVMVLDGAKWLLFTNEGDAKYPVLQTLGHQETEDPPSRELGTDQPGRAFASYGGARSAYSETDWQSQAETRFAKHAADVLEQASTQRRDNGIVVIAAPRALGDLRKSYGRHTSQHLLAEIPKDLAGHTTDDITQVIAAHAV